METGRGRGRRQAQLVDRLSAARAKTSFTTSTSRLRPTARTITPLRRRSNGPAGSRCSPATDRVRMPANAARLAALAGTRKTCPARRRERRIQLAERRLAPPLRCDDRQQVDSVVRGRNRRRPRRAGDPVPARLFAQDAKRSRLFGRRRAERQSRGQRTRGQGRPHRSCVRTARRWLFHPRLRQGLWRLCPCGWRRDPEAGHAGRPRLGSRVPPCARRRFGRRFAQALRGAVRPLRRRHCRPDHCASLHGGAAHFCRRHAGPVRIC